MAKYNIFNYVEIVFSERITVSLHLPFSPHIDQHNDDVKDEHDPTNDEDRPCLNSTNDDNTNVEHDAAEALHNLVVYHEDLVNVSSIS